MKKKGKLSPSSEFEKEISREFQIVDNTTSSVFKLPSGWSVEGRRRINSPSHPGRVDKMQIVPCNTKNASSFGLPDDWIVQERPRSRGSIIDKHYIETGTGLRFRSRISVERYLAAKREVMSASKAKSDDQLIMNLMKKDIFDENQTLSIMVRHLREAGKINFKPKALKPDSHSAPSKNSSFQDKHSSGMAVNASILDFSILPAEVKWVLGGPGGHMWNPFVGESMVPESVKQEWYETFADTMRLQATDKGGIGISG